MKKLFFLLINAALLNSCKDFFENPRPQEVQWVNTTTFDQGLSSAYYNLFYNCLNGKTAMIEFSESGVSQLLPETSTSVPWNETFHRMFNANFPLNDEIWRFCYATVTTCNEAIELDESKSGNPFGLDESSSDYTDNYVRQMGEYHFMRAYAYYTLLRNFSAPYVHNGYNSNRYIPFNTKVPET